APEDASGRGNKKQEQVWQAGDHHDHQRPPPGPSSLGTGERHQGSRRSSSVRSGSASGTATTSEVPTRTPIATPIRRHSSPPSPKIITYARIRQRYSSSRESSPAQKRSIARIMT